LFGGVFERVNKDVIRRAKLLADALQEEEAGQEATRKLELLRVIIVEPQILAENS
jgi:hypothetical protein